MLGRVGAGVGFLGQAERTRMTVSRPRRQQKQEAGISLSENLAALMGFEFEQRPGTPPDARLTTSANLDFAGHYDQPGVLMDLVLSQPLTSGNLQHDDARRRRRGDDPRVVRLRREGRDIPALHRIPFLVTRAAVPAAAVPIEYGEATPRR
jgi:hypothetical protein